MEIETPEGELTSNFKTETKYAHRYISADVFNSTEVVLSGRRFRITEDNAMEMTHLHSGKKSLVKNKKSSGERSLLLIGLSDAVLHFKESFAKYHIYKYNKNGKLSFGKSIMPRRFLKYFTHTNHRIVFTPQGHEGQYNKTHIINLRDGEETILDFNIHGVILDEKADDSIDGYCQINEADKSLKIHYGEKNFQVKIPNIHQVNWVKTVVKDGWLILACYQNQTSGAQLLGIDIETGAVEWKADVTKLSLSSDIENYENTTILSAYKDKVILESWETEGRCLQIFDLHSGKKLYKKPVLYREYITDSE
ncbi:MAG: hypothetical protein GY810_03395 [Aureispira sp.]|nr:hypothetical protein [Aureispira sp.]